MGTTRSFGNMTNTKPVSKEVLKESSPWVGMMNKKSKC